MELYGLIFYRYSSDTSVLHRHQLSVYWIRIAFTLTVEFMVHSKLIFFISIFYVLKITAIFARRKTRRRKITYVGTKASGIADTDQDP
jgi:hypothetical protein